MTDEEIRAALAEALMHHSWCTDGQPMVSVTGAVESRGQCNCLPARQQEADALLPTVRRLMQQQAAEELDDWARSFRACGQAAIAARQNRVVFPQVAKVLEAGACDLRAAAALGAAAVSATERDRERASALLRERARAPFLALAEKWPEIHYAGMQAVREMPSDWYCPRSEPGRCRRDCPECVAEVALDAARAAALAEADQ